ncbi:ABC transporter permease family protein [Acidipropionibacterium timonense]|uniref:FtsX-like permease family protein n=1 Tax=Acidipropionibacterium timonense TaxID=2161818 RepID=UPI00102F4BC1|nr:FtsX-like permease family protein [Acidipropionibacterium timonense]
MTTALPAPPAPLSTPGRPRPRRGTLLHLFAAPTLADRRSWRLPVVAFAVITTIVLDVIGGAAMFWRMTGDIAPLYRMLSTLAVILLVLPLATLAVSATKLSARRRDDRLAALRLVGASSATLRGLTLAESGANAFAGIVLGLVGYGLSLPLLGMLHFGGHAIGGTSLLLDGVVLLGVVAALMALALVSSAVGLRRVEISPLGVRMRQEAAGVSRWRVVIGAVLLVAAVLAAQSARLLQVKLGAIVGVAVSLSVIATGLIIVDIVGPRLLALHMRRRLRRSRTAVDLVAARMVLESPRAAWRQVAALGSACFVGVAGGSGVALMKMASAQATAQDLALIHDVQTGIILTLAFAFATVACSVGVNQAAAVLDRRDVEVGLDVVGMTLGQQDAARRKAVLSPLWFVMAVSVGSAAVVLAPLVGAALLMQPLTILVTAAVMALGAGLVIVGLRATRPVLSSVLGEGLARAE